MSPLKGAEDGARPTDGVRPRFVMYLAVLPDYRREFVRALKRSLGDSLQLIASAAHLNPTIRTGIPEGDYLEVSIRRFGRKAFLQLGGIRQALSAESVVVDLNPRSLTAWLILVTRRMMRRRTVVWGHLHPRAGSESRSSKLRRSMRLMADGFISYTLTNADEALRDAPHQPVWAATNALYSRDQLREALALHGRSAEARSDYLYVGRFEEPKKVEVAVRAFSLIAAEIPESRLVLIGDGTQRSNLERLAAEEGVADRVIFPGWQSGFEALRGFYAHSVCALSPGFGGLGITQSLGFGVPILVSRDEPHSPEIELEESGGVVWFSTDDVHDLADQMRQAFAKRATLPRLDLVDYVMERYTAESMALGVVGALTDDREFAAERIRRDGHVAPS